MLDFFVPKILAEKSEMKFIKNWRVRTDLSATNKQFIVCVCTLAQGCQMVYLGTYQKSKFGYSEGLERVSLVYIWPFGMFNCHLYIFCTYIFFVVIWYVEPRKIWQPCSGTPGLHHLWSLTQFPTTDVV
jgi:hypothetical protein